MAKRPEQQSSSPFNALIEARRQKLEQSNSQTSEHLTVQTENNPAATLAKSVDPEFMKFTTYVRKKTHRAVKIRLVEQNREMSELVEELLHQWLAGSA